MRHMQIIIDASIILTGLIDSDYGIGPILDLNDLNTTPLAYPFQ